MAHSSQQANFIGQSVAEVKPTQLPPLEHRVNPFRQFRIVGSNQRDELHGMPFVNSIALHAQIGCSRSPDCSCSFGGRNRNEGVEEETHGLEVGEEMVRPSRTFPSA